MAACPEYAIVSVLDRAPKTDAVKLFKPRPFVGAIAWQLAIVGRILHCTEGFLTNFGGQAEAHEFTLQHSQIKIHVVADNIVNVFKIAEKRFQSGNNFDSLFFCNFICNSMYSAGRAWDREIHFNDIVRFLKNGSLGAGNKS